MFSQRLALSRPLAYQALPIFSSASKRTFLAGLPRMPRTFEEYPNYDDTTDPDMVCGLDFPSLKNPHWIPLTTAFGGGRMVDMSTLRVKSVNLETLRAIGGINKADGTLVNR